MTELLPATRRALDHLIATRQAEDRVPSMTAVLWRGRDVLWAGARGTTGTDAGTGAHHRLDVQYRIGSISKTFTGACILRLRDEGLLSLSDTLDTYAPGTTWGDRTLLQLLSQGGGTAAETPRGPWWERSAGLSWEELIAGAGPAVLPAGQQFHYSNLGTASLGRVIEVIRGRSWWDVVRAELVTPLGLGRTSYLPEMPYAQGFSVHPYADLLLAEPHTDTGAMAPAGQLWSTVQDLAVWGQFLAGTDDHDDVLSAATREEMRDPVQINDGDEWDSAYGLGVQVFRSDGRHWVGHGGSMPGFVAMLAVDTGADVGAATLANTTSMAHGELAFELVELLTKLEPADPDEWAPSPASAAALELIGTWYRGPRPTTLSARGSDELYLAVPAGGEESRFVPYSDDVWRGLDGYYAGELLRPVRAADGTVRQLDVGTFCLTREPYDPTADLPGGLDDRGWYVP